MDAKFPPRERGDGRWIFTRRIWHVRARRFVYPKNGRVFRIWVKNKRR